MTFGGEGEAADDELLLANAFGFEPVGAAAGDVGCGGALGDDAFGVELAGLAEDGGAVGFDVLAEADVVVGALARRAARSGFALEERKVAQVVAVEVEEIEDEVGEGLFGCLPERRPADRRSWWCRCRRGRRLRRRGWQISAGRVATWVGDGLHAVRPVEAGAGEELDVGAGLAGLDAVAVELQFVEPAVGGGWGGGLSG